MTTDNTEANDNPTPTRALRERAEKLLRTKPADVLRIPVTELQTLVHELCVHEIELEMQNEDLRQAQLELAHTRDFYSDLYEFAPVGYITIDKSGNILEANLTITTMLGVGRQAFIGKNLSKFIMYAAQDDFYRYRQALFAAEDEQSDKEGTLCTKQACEIDMHKADGTPLTMRLESSTFVAENNRQCRMALIDITERKQAEQMIQNLNEQLEQRVVALKQAKQEAEQANALKTQFLTAASHDLRQPLQALQIYISILEEQPEQLRQQEIRDNFHHTLDTMEELLSVLLDLSQLQRGKITLQKQDIAVKQLLDHVVVNHQQQAQDKKLQINVNDTDCIVYSDPGLLRRVFDNLIANAVRYTEAGGHISIDCQCNDEDAKIAISDTGIGIPGEALENIFEEYYQLDNPARNRGKGLGIGLSIVKHITALLDHRIEVSSTPGEGSTFTLTVPLGKLPKSSAGPSAAVPQQQKQDRKQIVLFVDDNPFIIKSIEILLKSKGVAVHSAFDGETALSYIETGIRPDIIITDYRLPGLNGIEIIRRVRAVIGDDLPAILLTGDMLVQKQIEVEKPANCTVLIKPVNAKKLLGILSETELAPATDVK